MRSFLKMSPKGKAKKIKRASRDELPTMKPTKVKQSKKKINLGNELIKELRFHLELLREDEGLC